MFAAVCFKVAVPLMLLCGLPESLGDAVAEYRLTDRQPPPGVTGPFIVTDADVDDFRDGVLLLAKISLAARQRLIDLGLIPPSP